MTNSGREKVKDEQNASKEQEVDKSLKSEVTEGKNKPVIFHILCFPAAQAAYIKLSLFQKFYKIQSVPAMPFDKPMCNRNPGKI